MIPYKIGETVYLQDLVSDSDPESSSFRIIDLIEGGQGVCLRVQDSAGESYAAKVIRREYVEDPIAWERFTAEMKTWLTLSSCDGVVPAFCITRLNELPCICSKWMEGGNLRTFMQSTDQTFFFETVDRIIGTLQWVLENHGFVHRDLKPENILLDEESRAYISDWGLSRLVDSHFASHVSRTVPEPASRLTAPGVGVGTVYYASPEQLGGSPNLDHRSDIYSIGCIVYEWETGHPPFYNGSVEEIIYQHLYEAPPRIGGLRRRSKFRIGQLIARCLDKAPDRRFQDYKSLRHALISAATRLGVSFSPYVPADRQPTPRIGKGEFQARLFGSDFCVGTSQNSEYAVVDMNKTEPYLKEAEALLSLGQYQEAHDIFARLFVPELVQRFPDLPYHHYFAVNYAITLIKLGRAADAMSVLSSISASKPLPSEYYLQLSLCHLHVNQPADAERVARDGLTLYPHDPELLGNLTIAEMHQGKLDDASRTARRRLQIKRDIHALEELSCLCMRLGERDFDSEFPSSLDAYTKAILLLKEAKALNPRYTTARLNLARALFEIERYADASSELHELQSIPMHHTLAERCTILMAECLNRVAAFDRCIAFCDRFLAKLPDSTGLQRVKAETLADGYCIGFSKDGKRSFNRWAFNFFANIVNEKNKRQKLDFCYLARFLEWVGDVDAAYQVLDDAEEMWPNFWVLPLNRAQFELRRGRLDEGLAVANKLVTLAPWHSQSWRTLAAIYNAMGRSYDEKEATARADSVQQQRDKLLDESHSQIVLP